MRTSSIPLEPLPLTPELADDLLQRRMKKHHVAMVLLHWFNAWVWFLELVTGVALISSPYFRVAPVWYIEIVEGLFGSRANMLQFHVALGLLWIFVYLVYGIFGFRTYLTKEVLRREMALDRDDWRWLLIRTLLILGRSKEPLPPQGVYNAGQKLFAVMVYLTVPVVMLSGLVMAFQLGSPALVGWAVVFHFAAVGAVVAGLMVHMYMGAVFPEEKPAFFSMITGSVDELFAYNHHFKWWREMKLAEKAWEDEHEEGPAPPAAAAASGEPPAPEKPAGGAGSPA